MPWNTTKQITKYPKIQLLSHTEFERKDERKGSHCLMLNTTSFSCWCYECDEDVYPDDFENFLSENHQHEVESPKATIPASGRLPGPGTFYNSASISHPQILVGLENIGNSCYINAALQILLNWYPLIVFVVGKISM